MDGCCAKASKWFNRCELVLSQNPIPFSADGKIREMERDEHTGNQAIIRIALYG